MTTVLLSILFVSVVLLVGCGVLVLSGRLRREGFVQSLRRARYESYLYEYLSSPMPSEAPLRLLEHSSIDRKTIGETVVSLATLFSNIRADRKAEIERRYSLGDYFVQRAMAHRGAKRLEALRILVGMTPDKHNAEILEGMRSVDSHSAAMLLVLRVIASPRRAAEAIERFDYQLSDSRIYFLTEQIVRRRVGLDWRRSLASRNPNLQRVGMAIVRTAAIADAEEPLLQMLSDADSEVVFDGLRTIASLQLPLADNRIAEAVGRLDHTARKRFYRIVVRNGYSEQALRPLVRNEQRFTEPLDIYLQAVADSYKHPLR